jgi:hypothetical protein
MDKAMHGKQKKEQCGRAANIGLSHLEGGKGDFPIITKYKSNTMVVYLLSIRV